MTPLTPDEIWTIYQNLPNKQQVLVQLVAVAYDPLRYSEARALYVEFFERRAEKVSPRVKALNELAGFHVLEGDGSWVAVAEEIAEDVCYHAVRCGHLTDLLAVTEPHFQAGKYALRDFPAVRRRLLADGSTVLVNLPASAREESLEALSSRISQLDTLELIPLGLYAVLIFHMLERSFTVHSHIDRFLNYLGAATAKGEPLHEEIQFHQFLRGSGPAEPSPKVRSAMGFFEGEKAPDKPFSPPFEGASSLWDFLSHAVQRPTQEELSLCRDVVLQKCVPLWSTDEPSGGESFLESWISKVGTLGAFYLCVTYLWSGLEQKIPLKELRRIRETLESTGYGVLATQLSLLEQFVLGTSSELSPLLRLNMPRPRWERALEKLDSLAQPAPSSRLVWIVNPLYVAEPLFCRVQSIGARGDWTKGQRVKLSELQEWVPIFDQHDRRVWEAILRLHGSKNTYLWGSNPRRLYPALIGHPRLFLHKDEYRRVEFVRGTPVLQTSREGDDILVTLAPWVGSRQDIHSEEAGSGVFEIFEPHEKYRQIQEILGERGLRVPLGQVDRLRGLLATLAREDFLWWSDDPGSVEDQETRRGDSTIVIRLWPVRRGLYGSVLVKSLSDSPRTFPPGLGPAFYVDQGILVQRDLERERENFEKIAAIIGRKVSARDTFPLPLPEFCLDFLAAVQELPDEVYRLEWPRGQKFRLRDPLKVEHLQLSVRSSNDWFSLEGSVKLSPEERLSLLELLERERSEERFVTLKDGSLALLTSELRRVLRRLRVGSRNRSGEGLEFSRLTCPMLEQLNAANVDEEFRSYSKRVEEVFSRSFALPKEFKASLRPYQMEGFQWLSRAAELGWGVCLADEMGLGKTVQTLAMLSRRTSGPSLVVAPTSVAGNWCDEAYRFCPSLRPILLSEAGDRKKVVKSLGKGDLLVISYGLLIREVELLREIDWGNLVLDEAQAIKNPSSKRFQAAISLRAGFRLACTGTPVENRVDELWALFTFLNPGLLGSKASFDQRLSGPDSLEALAALTRPFILRRLKSEVLDDLPERVESTVRVELSRKEKVYYEKLRLEAVTRAGNGRDALSVLAELTRLRRVCCHPALVDPETSLPSSKLETFLDMLENVTEGGHQALVFSLFVDHICLVRRELEQRGIPFRYLDGKTPVKKRAEEVQAFQDGQAPVFLISLKAGGTGLNLTRANYVFHLDPWWNPAVEDQASDRAHRIGQKRSVTIYRLVAKDTIEEKILELHEEKRDLADRLLAGTEASAQIDLDTLRELLAGTLQSVFN